MRTCAECQAELVRPPHVSNHQWEQRRFCGPACYRASRRGRTVVVRNPPPARPPRFCSLPGCGRRHQARGLCQSHYVAAHRTGHLPPGRERSTRQHLRLAEALVVRELAAGAVVPREVIACRTGLHPSTVSDAVSTVRRLFGRNIIATWPREGYELAGPLPGWGA